MIRSLLRPSQFGLKANSVTYESGSSVTTNLSYASAIGEMQLLARLSQFAGTELEKLSGLT